MKIVLTNQALESLNSSFLFMIEMEGVPYSKIDEIRDRIKERIEKLPITPFQGQRELFLINSKKEYRRIVEGNFKIIYYIEKDEIFITDIFDARQDPEKMKG